MPKKGYSQRRRGREEWIVLASEYLVLKESNQELTIAQFCKLKDDLPYNSARVQMKKVLEEIEKGLIKPLDIDDVISDEDDCDQSSDQSCDQLDEDAGVAEAVEEENIFRNNSTDPAKPGDIKALAKASKERTRGDKIREAVKDNLNAKQAGMYSKYLDPDLVKKACDGTLENDKVFYRTKILMGLDFVEVKLLEITELEIELGNEKEKDRKEVLITQIESIEKRIHNTEKLINFFLGRIENVEKTIKNIELMAVTTVKERENVLRVRAQTKTLLQQARKFRAEQQKLKAEEAALKNSAGGSDIDKIIRSIQETRDGLPSAPKLPNE